MALISDHGGGWARSLANAPPLAYIISMWAPVEIQFDDIDYDATDHPVVTIRMATPVGVVEAMAEVTEHGCSLQVRRLHVQSAVEPNAIGLANWRLIANVVL